MSDTKHTPTPWGIKGTSIRSEKGGRIANTGNSFVSFAEDEANAAHIVKCVNMHDELVEALKTVLFDLEIGAHPHLHINDIREALKKAGAL